MLRDGSFGRVDAWNFKASYVSYGDALLNPSVMDASSIKGLSKASP